MIAALCLAVFLASAAVDFAHTRYVQAVEDRRGRAAARWSVGQWAAATIGFVAAVKFSMVVLPFEAAGLYAGTLLAMRPHAQNVPSARLLKCERKPGTTSERSARRDSTLRAS